MAGGDCGLSGPVLATVGEASRGVSEDDRGALSRVAEGFSRLLRSRAKRRRGDPLRILRGRYCALRELRGGIADDLGGPASGARDLAFDHCRLRLASPHPEPPPPPPPGF